MNTENSIRKQLSKLNIKNNITELLISILNINDDDDIYTDELTRDDIVLLLDDLYDLATNSFEFEVDDKDEIIKILNYYLKVSNPTQNCYFVITNIIDNLNGTIFNEGIEFDVSDFNNEYLILLYYINWKF